MCCESACIDRQKKKNCMLICRTMCTKLVKVNEVEKLLKNDEQIEMYFVRNGANRNWYVILTGPFFKMIQTPEEEKKIENRNI